MMVIEITKIIDEMVDIRTGEHFTHGVVISNGQREVFIPLRRESLQPLLELYAEAVGIKEEVPKQEPMKATPSSIFEPLEPEKHVLEPGEDYSDELTGTASI